MKVVFGLKTHSGWAALVVLGKDNGTIAVVDRQRIELAEERWAKQPYHAAAELETEAALEMVNRGVAVAHRIAKDQIRLAVEKENNRHNQVIGCSVLTADRMPDWTAEQILAVHFRMHKAEGMLFRNAVVAAARACSLPVISILEKELATVASRALNRSDKQISNMIFALGKKVGAPWQKDQKNAALAALISLESEK
ncbi:MAG: hypothetical protein ABR555_02255 [Pyrinomonadaceae bacterium]